MPARSLKCCPARRLVDWPAAGLLEEFVDQRLADAGGDLLVDRHHRLSHGLVLLRRQRDDLGLAGLLDLLQRVLVLLDREAVAILGRLLHCLTELVAYFCTSCIFWV